MYVERECWGIVMDLAAAEGRSVVVNDSRLMWLLGIKPPAKMASNPRLKWHQTPGIFGTQSLDDLSAVFESSRCVFLLEMLTNLYSQSVGCHSTSRAGWPGFALASSASRRILWRCRAGREALYAKKPAVTFEALWVCVAISRRWSVTAD